MDYYKQTLIEELERNLKSQDVYSERKKLHRHGSIVVKTIKGHQYIYLVYRNKNKVIYEYVGVYSEENLEIIENEKNNTKNSI